MADGTTALLNSQLSARTNEMTAMQFYKDGSPVTDIEAVTNGVTKIGLTEAAGEQLKAMQPQLDWGMQGSVRVLDYNEIAAMATFANNGIGDDAFDMAWVDHAITPAELSLLAAPILAIMEKVPEAGAAFNTAMEAGGQGLDPDKMRPPLGASKFFRLAPAAAGAATKPPEWHSRISWGRLINSDVGWEGIRYLEWHAGEWRLNEKRAVGSWITLMLDNLREVAVSRGMLDSSESDPDSQVCSMRFPYADILHHYSGT